jgi:hypothetical protein
MSKRQKEWQKEWSNAEDTQIADFIAFCSSFWA